MIYVVFYFFSSEISRNSSYLMSKMQQEVQLLCELQEVAEFPVSSQGPPIPKGGLL